MRVPLPSRVPAAPPLSHSVPLLCPSISPAAPRHADSPFPNSSWPTLPQVYIKGEFVGGFDIVSQLYSSGELHNMLRTHNLIPTEEKASE